MEAATESGRVRGLTKDGILAFLGIPYAAPPIDDRRFRAPAPPEPWLGVRDATAFGTAAPQHPPPGIALWPGLDPGPQDEDCLYLNVYTPATHRSDRPVLVWIHGGGFDYGAASQPYFDGSAIATRGDVVVVTLNYRLGALGFLLLDELIGPSACANAGLLDQIAALRWVQANVSNFGGDPGNVTVFGESAGAICITTLMAARGTQGLFRRAIAQSGALQPLHSRRTATEIATGLLAELGLAAQDAAALRQLDVAEILAAQRRLIERWRGSPENLIFRPAIDGDLVPEAPSEALRTGEAKDIPLLVGTNRDECRPFVLADPEVRELDEALILDRIRQRSPLADLTRLSRAYGLEQGHGDFVGITSEIATDHHFRLPAIRLAEIQSHHQQDTFMYRFDWESPGFGGALGACHGIEVPFVFGTLDQPGMESFTGAGAEARRLSRRITDAWIAFARSGRPDTQGLPDWPPYDSERRATMRLGRSCGIEFDPGAERRRAWEIGDSSLSFAEGD